LVKTKNDKKGKRGEKENKVTKWQSKSIVL
jgi:hypothetical protein